MTYTIVYDHRGNPACVQAGDRSIPFDPQNSDFQDFLRWNAAQAQPLDWKTSITPPEPVLSANEIDAQTDAAIGAALHPFAPIGEQIGELRNALVVLFNELGIELPVGFARFNDIAIAEIVKGQAKKAVL